MVDHNTRNFYGLPKVHNSQPKTNANKEQDLEVVNFKEPMR